MEEKQQLFETLEDLPPMMESTANDEIFLECADNVSNDISHIEKESIKVVENEIDDFSDVNNEEDFKTAENDNKFVDVDELSKELDDESSYEGQFCTITITSGSDAENLPMETNEMKNPSSKPKRPAKGRKIKKLKPKKKNSGRVNRVKYHVMQDHHNVMNIHRAQRIAKRNQAVNEYIMDIVFKLKMEKQELEAKTGPILY